MNALPASTRLAREKYTLYTGLFFVGNALIWSGVTTRSFLLFFCAPPADATPTAGMPEPSTLTASPAGRSVASHMRTVRSAPPDTSTVDSTHHDSDQTPPLA